jgi:hypothetical protein
VFFCCPAAVVAFAAAAVPPLLLRYECFSASYFVIKEEIKNDEFETLLLLLLLLSQAGESRGVVGTMVLLELLLLLKLRFVLGIVSSAFFQVEVGGRSLLWPLVLLLFAAVACAALLLLLLTRWPAVWYLSFYNFPPEEYKCLDLAGIHILTLIFRLTPAMLHNLVSFVFLKAFPTVDNCRGSPFKVNIVGDPGTTGTCGLTFVGRPFSLPLRSSQIT